MRERRRIAWAGREEAVVAVLRESAVLQARAQHVFVARVNRETEEAQRICHAAHAALETETDRILQDWLSPRWGEEWSRQWKARRLEDGILS